MRDLTDRALDTAIQPGRRLCRRPDRPPARTSRSPSSPAGSRASPPARSEGFGVRVLVDGAWGFASSHRLDLAEADRVAGARGPDRPGVGDRAARPRGPRRPRRRPTARYETPGPARTRSRSRSSGRSPTSSPRTGPPAPCKGVTLHRVRATAPSASGRRSPRPTAASRSRSSPTSAPPSRRTRSRATSTSVGAIRTPAAAGAPAGYEFIRGLDLLGNAERHAEEAVALLDRPAVPGRRDDGDPRPEPALHTRSTRAAATRPSWTASSGPRRRYAGTSFLTTDKLDDGLPLRLRPRDDRRRRDLAGRHGDVRLGRRGRRGAVGAARPGRDLRRLPDVAGDGAPDRAVGPAGRCAPTAGTGSR